MNKHGNLPNASKMWSNHRTLVTLGTHGTHGTCGTHRWTHGTVRTWPHESYGVHGSHRPQESHGLILQFCFFWNGCSYGGKRYFGSNQAN